MNGSTRKLLTIVTEGALERPLTEAFERMGARGYTITDARGKGSRGVRSGTWGENSNIRVEIICDTATAETIMAHMQTHYYDNYAMVMFVGDVTVQRPAKF